MKSFFKDFISLGTMVGSFWVGLFILGILQLLITAPTIILTFLIGIITIILITLFGYSVIKLITHISKRRTNTK